MITLSNGQYIIGFDNVYQFGKTAQKETTRQKAIF